MFLIWVSGTPEGAVLQLEAGFVKASMYSSHSLYLLFSPVTGWSVGNTCLSSPQHPWEPGPRAKPPFSQRSWLPPALRSLARSALDTISRHIPRELLQSLFPSTVAPYRRPERWMFGALRHPLFLLDTHYKKVGVKLEGWTGTRIYHLAVSFYTVGMLT